MSYETQEHDCNSKSKTNICHWRGGSYKKKNYTKFRIIAFAVLVFTPHKGQRVFRGNFHLHSALCLNSNLSGALTHTKRARIMAQRVKEISTRRNIRRVESGVRGKEVF